MKTFFGALIILACIIFVLSLRAREPVTYGVSFSKLHADELHLDWKETYRAILDDLGAKHLRLSATWPMIEPKKGEYHFEELDYQMRLAESHGADVILAIGRKTPGWPECHFPEWAKETNDDEAKARLAYMSAVVNRYKNSAALKYWQVENEPFLNFARERCGIPNEDFFKQEVALVRSLDPQHAIVSTDGGEFGLWYKPARDVDIFGSTLYLYVYTHAIGYWRYPLTPGFFRVKQNILDLIAGKKHKILIELGLEPWLHSAIIDAPLDEQLQHMSMDRFREIILFARETTFGEQYLWGAEWWYYMREKGHPEFWSAAKNLMAQ